MTSNSIPVYRHGRKFYVSAEEYELLRAEDRRHRRRLVQKSQHLPVTKSVPLPARSSSSSLVNPLRRTASNPFEQPAGILKSSYSAVNSSLATPVRRGSPRPSRSILRNSEDPSTSTGYFVPRKNSSETIRTQSLDRAGEQRQLSLADDEYLSSNDEIKRSNSDEVIELPMLSDKLAPQVPIRRPIPTTVADYGMSPISSFSMTPTDQTYSQSNASKLTSYFVQVKPSSLNPLAKSTPSNHGELLETGLQGTDHAYAVLGSSNRRSGGDGGSSIVTGSITNSSANEFFSRDAASGSLSEDSSSSLLMLVQRRKVDTSRYRRPNFVIENDGEPGEEREGWTHSATQSQLTDMSMEKKRVRFADMEGFTLETIPDATSRRSPVNARLLTRRKPSQVTTDLRTGIRPVLNNFYQTIAGVGGGSSRRGKLTTDA